MMIENPSHLMKQLTHGVYVVGVGRDDYQNAFTAAWLMQVSFQPLLLAISINPANYSYQLLRNSGVCAVSVLDQTQYALAEHFGRAIKDKMLGFRWQTAKTGAPILSESLAYFDCELCHCTDAGDHKIAVCRVVDAAILNPGEPLRYQQTGNMDGSDKLYR